MGSVWALVSTALAWDVARTEAGDTIRWVEAPVEWQLAVSGAPAELDVGGAAVAATAAWQGVPGAELAFFQAPDIDLGGPATGTVWWDAERTSIPDDQVAYATIWSTDGAIFAFDVAVDPTVEWATDGHSDRYDLQAVLTHEVGHVLGFLHSDVEGAVMMPGKARGDLDGRVLAEDDEAAAVTVYPDLPALLPEGCSSGALPFACVLGLLRRRTS